MLPQAMRIVKSVKIKLKKCRKMVKGMFEFTDAQGGWLDFSYRFFPGEPLQTIRIMHGEICDLPMILVRHLNGVHKKVRVPKTEDYDKTKGLSFTRISRCKFIPMDVFNPELLAM
jgi:hypothetical protein